jgi:hypothetical protein
MRERDPGRATARADVDDRAVEAGDELEAAQRIVEEHTARLVEVADRRQARRRDNGGEPSG